MHKTQKKVITKSRQRINNNSKTKSKLKTYKCKFNKTNTCQSKNSGGHKNAIKSINTKFCAKKISANKKLDDDLEYKFTSDPINHINMEKYMPKYNGICVDGNNIHIITENVKSTMANPISLDVKIGFKTYNTDILRLRGYTNTTIFAKQIKQKIIDKNTISPKMGFRAEGLEGDGVKTHIKSTLKKMNPYKFMDDFFVKDKNNDALDRIIKKLDKFNVMINKKQFNHYLLVGSSLLIIYDGSNPKKTSVKMIDFGNSYKYDEKNRAVNTNYVNGVKNLINAFKNYKTNKK
jgi:hypothetical protein